MDLYLPIKDIYAREILDSGGYPAIEAEVLAGEEIVGRAAVTAVKNGEEIQKTIENINSQIAPELIGINVASQEVIDQILFQKEGALPVSLAASLAAAEALKLPLYRYLGGMRAVKLPVPVMNLIQGGTEKESFLDFREFMIVPSGISEFHNQLQAGAAIYHALKQKLEKDKISAKKGDEGGFVLVEESVEEVLSLMKYAVEQAGYESGREVQFAVDAGAHRFYDRATGNYHLPGEAKKQGRRIEKSSEELIAYYEKLTAQYAICSLENPLSSEDDEGWKQLMEKLGDELYLLGGGEFSDDSVKLRQWIKQEKGNSILIKMHQNTTLTELFQTVKEAQKTGMYLFVAHASDETEDTALADLAVACEAVQIRTGAPCRSERVAKYNRLLRIEEKLGNTIVSEIK